MKPRATGELGPHEEVHPALGSGGLGGIPLPVSQKTGIRVLVYYPLRRFLSFGCLAPLIIAEPREERRFALFEDCGTSGGTGSAVSEE